MSEPKRPNTSERDAFWVLAVLCIILGMLLVLSAAVFWALTGRQSSLIVGAGLTLAIGGGLRNTLYSIANQLPDYDRERAEDREQLPPPRKRGRK